MTQQRKRSNPPPSAMRRTPDARSIQERIAERAYQLFEMRGHRHGHDVEDWLAAEREVRTMSEPTRPTRGSHRPAVRRSPPKVRRAA